MSEARNPNSKRWGRRLLFFLLLAAILVTSCVLWLNAVGGSRLEAELALVREAGDPLTLAELAPPPVPDAENAAPLLLEAFDLVVEEPETWFDDDAFEAYEESPFDQDESWYTELAAWVARNEPALEKAREASALSACRFDLDWEQGIQMESPQVWGLLSLSQALRGRAIVAARAGDIDGAIATCAEMVQLAHVAMQDPLLIYLLVRAAMIDMALRTAQQVLARGPAASGALENLLARLAPLPRQEALHRAFVGERAFGFSAFDAVRNDPSQLNVWAAPSADSDLLSSLLLRIFPDTVIKLDGAHYLAMMRRMLELAGRPYRETRSNWLALKSEQRDHPWYAVLSPAVSSVFVSVIQKWAEHQTRVDLARLALELELHRREHGRLPETLADLPIPLPTDDPFRDAPYVLVTTGDGGWFVYSVGPDGKDDGGAPLDDDDRGDLVWRQVAYP